jgi:acetolactate synthase-1/2/3 large subunit
MTDTVSQSYSFPEAPEPQLPFVHVWPDANEVGRVWRPDLGLPCSPHEVIKALLRRGAPANASRRQGWVDGLHGIHKDLLAKEWEPTTDGINFAAIVCEVDKHLAEDATITSDAISGLARSKCFCPLSSAPWAPACQWPLPHPCADREPKSSALLAMAAH